MPRTERSDDSSKGGGFATHGGFVIRSIFRPRPLAAAWLAVALASATSAGAQTRLLRFPDIHGDEVAFTYAGDLWTAPVTGGTARG